MSYEFNAERYAGFQYGPATNNDITVSALEHMALGQAHGVVANGSRKKIADGTPVVNFGRTNTQWYVQVGIATGTVSDRGPTEIWPHWGNPNSVVFNVVWVTKIVPVPDSYFTNMGPGKRLSIIDWGRMANYALLYVNTGG